MSDVRDKIRKAVEENEIVIYMKGTPEMPRCGFSAATVQVLQTLNKPFTAIDVLADPDVWQPTPMSGKGSRSTPTGRPSRRSSSAGSSWEAATSSGRCTPRGSWSPS